MAASLLSGGAGGAAGTGGAGGKGGGGGAGDNSFFTKHFGSLYFHRVTQLYYFFLRKGMPKKMQILVFHAI